MGRTSVMGDRAAAPSEVDLNTPNVARMYDYYLGGKDNFAADREAAEKALEFAPQIRLAPEQNRAFIGPGRRATSPRRVSASSSTSGPGCRPRATSTRSPRTPPPTPAWSTSTTTPSCSPTAGPSSAAPSTCTSSRPTCAAPQRSWTAPRCASASTSTGRRDPARGHRALPPGGGRPGGDRGALPRGVAAPRLPRAQPCLRRRVPDRSPASPRCTSSPRRRSWRAVPTGSSGSSATSSSSSRGWSTSRSGARIRQSPGASPRNTAAPTSWRGSRAGVDPHQQGRPNVRRRTTRVSLP